MTQNLAIVWFRQDLRLTDNPAINHAIKNNYKILPVYILDDENAKDWKMGGASRWWLHQSLRALNASLNNTMIFLKGPADQILPNLIAKESASAIFWNRCYEPWRTERDKNIKEKLKSQGLDVKSFSASLLWEPWDVLKEDGTPYKVFTPYYRRGCLSRSSLPQPEAMPQNIPLHTSHHKPALTTLGLMPNIQWYDNMSCQWTPGEVGAQARLDLFLKSGLKNYKEDRNRPDMEKTSYLSPHLHFGEISPRTVWHTALQIGLSNNLEKDTDTFCSELGWREFSHSLLHFNPSLPHHPLQEKFKNYPWIENDNHLKAWQSGQTGIPIVDAGMRQLWKTGWMHNRVRMIVGSFLVKNLRLHWRHGEDWFWDTLVDADLANNAAGWQWIAGCGADAAPYFRIFNPVTQGEKFDPNGDYVRTYVPELKNLPNIYIHKPWAAPAEMTRDYPVPIVDLSESRAKALDGYQSIRGT